MPRKSKKSIHANDKAYLLAIPPEIRFLIYDFLPEMGHVSLGPVHGDRDSEIRASLRLPPLALVHPILREEVLSMKYARIRLEVHWTVRTSSFTRWMGKASVDVLRSIKSISIVISVPEDEEEVILGRTVIIDLNATGHVDAMYWCGVRQGCRRRHPTPTPDRRFHHTGCSIVANSQMEAVKAQLPIIMRQCMTKHPADDRLVFTADAFKQIKTELWYILGYQKRPPQDNE